MSYFVFRKTGSNILLFFTTVIYRCRWHRDGSRFLVVPIFHEIALLTTTDIVMIPPFHTECLGWMFEHG
jgi:hypothetical protein